MVDVQRGGNNAAIPFVQSSIKLTINGASRIFEGDPQMPLLWALRDILGLKGTKFGCAKGLCGACTIHIDDEAVKSCLVPVQSAIGKRVTTIEGLSEDGSHLVQVAWQEINVPQCGYCQSGQNYVCRCNAENKHKSFRRRHQHGIIVCGLPGEPRFVEHCRRSNA